MSHVSKTNALRIVGATLASLLAVGTASAATLNHHVAPSAAISVLQTDADPILDRPIVVADSTSAVTASRNCIRGHLAYGHC